MSEVAQSRLVWLFSRDVPVGAGVQIISPRREGEPKNAVQMRRFFRRCRTDRRLLWAVWGAARTERVQNPETDLVKARMEGKSAGRQVER